MLSDRICQLLTAYVDGELTDRQHQVIERLLRRSPEARAIVERLQEDSRRLRNLPRCRLNQDLSGQVLRTIADRRLGPARHAVRANHPAIPAWAGMVVAAAVLLIVGISSWFYIATTNRPVVVQGSQGSRPEQPRPPDLARKDPVSRTNPEPPRPFSTAPATHPEDGLPIIEPGTAPEKPTPPSTVLTEVVPPDPGIVEITRPRFIFTLPIRELDQEKTRQRLHDELVKEGGQHLELFCLDYGKAFDRLRQALEASGLRLLIDPGLKSRNFKADSLFYAEDITPDELARVLEGLGTEDRNAEARHRGDGQFGRLVISPFTPEDHHKLTELLGAESPKGAPPRTKAPLGVDIHQPLPEMTAEDLARALQGQGVPRPGQGKPVVQPPSHPERFALVLPENSIGFRPAASPEVKQFLASRKNLRPGTLHLLLVLRSLAG